MWNGWGRWMYGLLLVMQWELSNDEARLYVLTKLSMCLCDYLFNLLAFVRGLFVLVFDMYVCNVRQIVSSY